MQQASCSTRKRLFRRRVGPLALVLLVVSGPAASAAADSIVTNDAFLPGVHIRGATGLYITDVEIFNPQTTTVSVFLYFTPADTDGTTLSGLRITPDLSPRESVSLKDILFNYFGTASSYGLVEVSASQPLIVTSNTYNAAGALPGTYGQLSPGQPSRNALGFDDSIAGDLYATGIPNDANHRTNAVVMNPTGIPLEAGVQLVDASSQIYGTRIVTVPPYSLHQLNDIFGAEFSSFQPPQGGPWRLNFFVNLGNGSKILSYVTVTDLRTGDPYLIPGQAMVP